MSPTENNSDIHPHKRNPHLLLKGTFRATIWGARTGAIIGPLVALAYAPMYLFTDQWRKDLLFFTEAGLGCGLILGTMLAAVTGAYASHAIAAIGKDAPFPDDILKVALAAGKRGAVKDMKLFGFVAGLIASLGTFVLPLTSREGFSPLVFALFVSFGLSCGIIAGAIMGGYYDSVKAATEEHKRQINEFRMTPVNPKTVQ